MQIGYRLGLSGLALVLAVLATASCGGGSDSAWTDESGLLRYVPADTPYLFATGEMPPDELMDKLETWSGSIADGYVDIARELLDDAAGNPGFGAEDAETANALLDIASRFMTAEGRENAGFTRDASLVFYGNGLLPVMRMTLADGAKLEAEVARIEAVAGVEALVASSNGQDYRYWGDDDGRVVMAIVDDELILTVTPTALSDRHLGTILGGDLPAENIAESGKLEEIASGYEFGPHYLGFIDVHRIAATFLEGASGIDADLLSFMDYDRTDIPNVCRAEMLDMANVAPRLILGSTAMDAEQMGMNAVVELRQDIAAGLATIAAPVPGLGSLRSGLMSIGMGVDIRAARDFILARLDAVERDPFECELLSGISTEIPELRAIVNQPLPPDILDLRGFLFALDEISDFDIASGQLPTTVSARMLVASANAPALTAMAAMFAPEVANFEANGQPVRISLPLPLPIPLDPWAALTPTAVALAVGPGAEARLREMLAAPTADTRPFLAGDMNYRGYYALLAKALEFGQMMDPTAAAMTGPAQQLMAQMAAGPFEREIYEMRFTARGIEMPFSLTISD